MRSLVDYHIHTSRCGHAVGEMAAYVERAIAAGLPEIGFSDHIFLYWLPPDQRDPELAMPEDAFDTYVDDVARLQHRYREITIRLAVEADFIVDHESTLKGILDRYPWDYVLGSVHFIGDWGMDDSRYLARYDAWDIDDYYRRSSSEPFLPRIAVPTLCLAAEDDPFLPPAILRRLQRTDLGKVTLLTTGSGGHAGFVAFGRAAALSYWAEEEVVRWLATNAQGLSSERARSTVDLHTRS